jgi:hypothetical protein
MWKSWGCRSQVLFRSVHKLLMDTATSEYLFCTDFFGEGAVFQELFQATLSVVEGALSGALQDNHDAIGLLLMIRINYHHQLIMSRRRLPCLDNYLDRVNLLLWPRFKIAMDGHIASVREASTRAPSNHNASPHAGPLPPPFALRKVTPHNGEYFCIIGSVAARKPLPFSERSLMVQFETSRMGAINSC